MNRTEELRHYVEDARRERGHRRPGCATSAIEPLGLRARAVATLLGLPRRGERSAGAGFRARARQRPGGRVERGHRARTSQPGPHRARAGRPGGDALHLGHDRQAEGLHAHALQRAGDHRRRTSTGAGAGEVVVLCALPMFHVTGMQAGMNAPIYRGATGGAVALGPRLRRRCRSSAPKVTNWSAITTMLVDFLSNPKLERLRPILAARARRRRRGDARSAGEKAGRGDRPAVRRGLRPVRDHGAVAHQPAASPEAPVRAASRSSTPMRASWISKQ